MIEKLKFGKSILETITVALYGGTYFSSILDPQVVCIPLVEILSFTAIAIPASFPTGFPFFIFESMIRAFSMASLEYVM